MSRIRRSYCPEISALEGRQLLAARVAPPPATLPPPPMPPMVSFALSTTVVSQQSDSATIALTRTIGNTTYRGPLQVHVVSEPSPADGVNLPPVDQVVSFPADTSTPFVLTSATTARQAQDAYTAVQTETFTIPINRGAPLPADGPIPGQVYVTLDLQAVNGPPNMIGMGTAYLQIVAASDVTAPTITGSRLAGRDIQLTFSEPLDPATAQNVQNYILSSTGHLSPSELKFVKGDSPLNATPPARLRNMPKPFHARSAVYDAATQTVTLTPARSIAHSSVVGVIVSGVTDPSGNAVGRDSAQTQGMNLFSTTIYPAPRVQHARGAHPAHRAHR